MPKKHIANHFAEWMKRIGARLSDLESNHEELESQLERVMNSIRNGLGMRETESAREPS